MTKPTDEYFHRPELAQALASQALDTSLGHSGGTFLAAPRRTGKSTFVKQDLVPELRRRGVEVLYADLWLDRSVNPAIHIANAIREAMARDDGPAARLLTKALGGTRLTLGAFGTGVSLDLSSLGLSKDATMAEALQTMSRESGKKLVIVLDEAQHALTTEEGMNALFSLKAARDSLNTDDDLHGMQLIATGSNRDKLASLVNGREQAFFGADIINFPPLDEDYVAWALKRADIAIPLSDAVVVFRAGRSRPEGFRRALTQTRVDLASNKGLDPAKTLAALGRKQIQDARDEFLFTVNSLPPLQNVLLREMALDARRGGPKIGIFSAQMKQRLTESLDQEFGPAHGVSADTSAVQNALDALRGENHLWRSQRGTYSFEGEQCIEWLAERDTATAGPDSTDDPGETDGSTSVQRGG